MLCSGKIDSVCYRWMGGDIMSEEQILLSKNLNINKEGIKL